MWSQARNSAFATDGQYLWFLAARNREATVHPDARPGQFQPELWRYDLAEWFLASGEGTNYWEFNLAPNGAWWACAFTDVRRANEDIPGPAGRGYRMHSDGRRLVRHGENSAE